MSYGIGEFRKKTQIQAGALSGFNKFALFFTGHMLFFHQEASNISPFIYLR